MIILPSILSEDFSTLKHTIFQLEEIGVKAIHFDVMDNHFVPNLTFGAKFIADLRPITPLLFDVHLMIEKPYENLIHYIKAGANMITAHWEAFTSEKEIQDSIDLCHQHHVQFGLAIKPKTEIDRIFQPYLKHLDMVLVMTVEPGFGGQGLIPATIDKIHTLSRYIKEHNYTAVIEADGGINRDNIDQLMQNGVSYFVMGNAFFKEQNPALLLSTFQKMQVNILKTLEKIYHE